MHNSKDFWSVTHAELIYYILVFTLCNVFLTADIAVAEWKCVFKAKRQPCHSSWPSEWAELWVIKAEFNSTANRPLVFHMHDQYIFIWKENNIHESGTY